MKKILITSQIFILNQLAFAQSTIVSDKGITFPIYSHSARPSANQVGIGTILYNNTAQLHQYSNGNNWLNLSGLPIGILGQMLRNDGNNWIANDDIWSDGQNVKVGYNLPDINLDTHKFIVKANNLDWGIYSQGKKYGIEALGEVIGLYGECTSSQLGIAGVRGSSTHANGVEGNSTMGYGVFGQSSNGHGVRGISTNNIGVSGQSTSGYGVSAYSQNGYGIYSNSLNNIGIYGNSTNNTAVYGNSINAYGVFGNSLNAYGVGGNSVDGYGVSGHSSNNSGVYGESDNGFGIEGYSYSHVGVYAHSGTGYGLHGSSSTSYGTYGYSYSSVGIYGKSDLGQAGYFNGNVTITGLLLNPSDEKLKKSIESIDVVLDKLLKINLLSYEFKRNEFEEAGLPKGKHFGFTAQNIQKIFPELVQEGFLQKSNMTNTENMSKLRKLDENQENNEKILTVNYLEMIPILTKAIQEQQEIIEQLKKKVSDLEKIK